MIRVAVVGGTGFVGQRLCLALHAAGCAVRVLTRRRETHRDLLVLPDFQLIEADVHQPVALKQVLAGVDAVVNLVGILNESRRIRFEAVHVELPGKIVQACRQHGVRRLLHMSALGASAEGPSEYLRSKGRGEQRVLEAHGPELAVTVFRPSVIFGPGDHFINMFAGLLRLAPGVFPLACAAARLQPVHVDDVTRAMVAALTRHDTHGQRYNLCGPRAYSLQQILELIARHQGRRVRILPLPRGLSWLQAQLLQWAPGKPFTPDNYLSLQVASVCEGPFPAAFGFAPRPLETSLPVGL
jgi:uncharacterized protein YbjT (DUF2867 family)